tara:strand:+ start:16764 stop:18146 length:1383 start_codon:yes stop_codon:yes gene_type:complete
VNYSKKFDQYFPYIFLVIVLFIYNSFIAQFLNNAFWQDELFCLNAVKNTGINILQFTKESDTNPPLFYLILYSWYNIMGEKLNALRLLPVLTINLSFCLMYLTFIKNKLETVGYALSFYTFISMPFIYHTYNLRPYGLFILGISSTVFFLYSPIKNTRLKSIGYLGGLLISVYSHNFGLFFWFSHFFIYLIHFKFFKTLTIKNFLICNTLALILYLPWLPSVLVQINNSNIDWITPMTSTSLYELKTRVTNFSPYILIIGLVYQLYRLYRYKSRVSLMMFFIILLHILSPLIFIYILQILGKNIFQIRYLQQSLIAFYIFLAIFSYSKHLKKTIGFIFIILLFLNLKNFNYTKFENYYEVWNIDWKSLSRNIKSLTQNNTVYFHPNAFAFSLEYYGEIKNHYPIVDRNLKEISGQFYFYTHTKSIIKNVSNLKSKINPQCRVDLMKIKVKGISFFKVDCN